MQATEPACLIPIIRSGADSLVLVGDPAQLPPTVISQQATEVAFPFTCVMVPISLQC